MNAKTIEEAHEAFNSFINCMTKKDRIAIFHDTDGDGLCSAGLALKALDKLGLKVILTLERGREEIFPSDETIAKLKKHQINKLITLDKSVYLGPQSINDIEKFADVLIIDHHGTPENIQTKMTVMIIPQLFMEPSEKPNAYDTTQLVYDFFSELVDLEEFDWLAFGAIHDVPWGNEFTKKILKKYKMDSSEDPWETPLGMTMQYISLASIYDKSSPRRVVEELHKAETYEDILNSDLKPMRDEVNKEIEWHIENFEHEAQWVGDTAFYQINPKYKINSPFITIMSIKRHPDKTLVIITDYPGDKFRISLRRHDGKKDMNKLIQEISKDLSGVTGGGHPAATGAWVPKKDLKQFKKLVEWISGSGLIDIR